MSEQELNVIEERLLRGNTPIDVGAKVFIIDFQGNQRASGTITRRRIDQIWLDDDSEPYWIEDAWLDVPTQKEDIRSLINEIRRLRAILSR